LVQSIEGIRDSAEYGEEEITKPEVAKDEAEVIAEAVAAAPSAEDTIPKESEA
jgi:hypothetical protein